MVMREQDRHFLWSLLAAIGVIFVWKGLWDGVLEIPYLGDPWVLLFVGFAMLTFSGIIFKEFDPLGNMDESINKIAHFIANHPEKEKFTINYYDRVKKVNITIKADKIKMVEKGSLIIESQKGKEEVFIPLHRIKEIFYKGKIYWKL